MSEIRKRLQDIISCPRKTVIFLIKLTVSIGLIVYLGWIIDWKRASTILREVELAPLFMIILLSLGRLIPATYRWQLILNDNSITYSFVPAYTGYLIGSFYSMFLPGAIGGDVFRIARCTKHTGCQLGIAVSSVVMERLSGIIALIAIALFVYIVFPITLTPLPLIETSTSVTILATIGVILIIIAILSRRQWLRWLPSSSHKGFWNFLHSGIQTCSLLRGRTLLLMLLLSIVFQAADILVIFLLARMLGLTVPLVVFFAIVPFVFIISILPISLGGLGVREGLLTYLLAQFGVNTSDGVTLSFLVYLSRFIPAIPGGIIQLIDTFSGKQRT